MAYFEAAWSEVGAALCWCGRLGRRRHGAQYPRAPMLPLLARAIGLAMLWASFATCCANAQQADEAVFAPYVRAAEYCRGDVPRPMALSPDKQVLCIEGRIAPNLDLSKATRLAERGIAVIRSHTGDPMRAAKLANVLRDRKAIVVVRDACLQACASFLLIASSESYVLRGALVAWGVVKRAPDQRCLTFIEISDGAGPFFTSSRCEAITGRSDDREKEWLWSRFYQERIAGSAYTDPPESKFVRRALMNLFRSTGEYPAVLWTWNPRAYASAIKTRIVYQHYPDSQEEVDGIVKQLGFRGRVIYDP
jgi:hypothetical protein